MNKAQCTKDDFHDRITISHSQCLTSSLCTEKREETPFPQKRNSPSNYHFVQKPESLPVLCYFPPDISIFCQHHCLSRRVSLITAFSVISLNVTHCVISHEGGNILKCYRARQFQFTHSWGRAGERERQWLRFG